MFRRFLATLGFLSRLAPARVLCEADMRRSMFHLPLCGLVIGLCACAPVLTGLLQGMPLAQAWLIVMLSAWMTRGLHLDGLADVMDGAGQHLNPERFWVIIKDSRSGTFGVAALVLALLGQTVLFAEVLRARPDWGAFALPWVFVFGRACAVGFGRAHRAIIRPGLGGLFLAGATVPAVAWAFGLTLFLGVMLAALPAHVPTLAAGFTPALAPAARLAASPALLPAPWAVLGFPVLAALAALWPLHRLARAVGGINGDFLGAAIVLGETAAAAGLALALCP
ncbi:adenosylcobinamide-GDP ribazoletransferase [Humidesulfovibrio sp.]